MNPLTKNDRIEIIKDICSKFHKEGINYLEVIGQYEKYTPLFHFNIREPNDNWPFIFITELFGNEKYTTVGISPQMQRAQYHGDYDGLYGIVLQGINNAHISPGTFGSGRLSFPSMMGFSERPKLTVDMKNDFDNALLYLRDKVHYSNPETIKLNDSEFIHHTYNFF